jgi:amino acid transporter
MSLVVWAVAGLLAICGALCYAELGCSMPQSGGEHPYFMRAYGSLPAFLFSWTGITVTRPASIAIIILVFAEYLARIFTLDPSLVGIRCIALACVVFLTAVNACSLAMADLIVKGCTVIKVGALAMIGLIGLFSREVRSNLETMQSHFTPPYGLTMAGRI